MPILDCFFEIYQISYYQRIAFTLSRKKNMSVTHFGLPRKYTFFLFYNKIYTSFLHNET